LKDTGASMELQGGQTEEGIGREETSTMKVARVKNVDRIKNPNKGMEVRFGGATKQRRPLDV